MLSLQATASAFQAKFAGRGLLNVLSAGALLAFSGDLSGIDPVPLDQSVCSEVAAHDSALTVRARRALAEDALLVDLNVGVSVRNHVATVWGPIPSAELAQRAVEAVRRVPGLAQVISKLEIEKPADPLLEFLRQRQAAIATPRATPAPALERELHQPAILAARDEINPAPAKALSRRQTVTEAVVLMPSIALPMRPAVTAPSGGVAGASLADAIEKLRRTDIRYWRVEAEVSGGTVQLRGHIDSRDDLFALARAVSHVPGVERVLVAEVRCGR